MRERDEDMMGINESEKQSEELQHGINDALWIKMVFATSAKFIYIYIYVYV